MAATTPSKAKLSTTAINQGLAGKTTKKRRRPSSGTGEAGGGEGELEAGKLEVVWSTGLGKCIDGTPLVIPSPS